MWRQLWIFKVDVSRIAFSVQQFNPAKKLTILAGVERDIVPCDGDGELFSGKRLGRRPAREETCKKATHRYCSRACVATTALIALIALSLRRPLLHFVGE